MDDKNINELKKYQDEIQHGSDGPEINMTRECEIVDSDERNEKIENEIRARIEHEADKRKEQTPFLHEVLERKAEMDKAILKIISEFETSAGNHVMVKRVDTEILQGTDRRIYTCFVKTDVELLS